MKISALIDFFIHPDYFEDSDSLRRARLFVKANFLTSIFSISYIWLSIFFEYDKGAYLMAFNGISFLVLPFLAKSKAPISWLGNMYVTIGAIAVISLTYYSGGIWSAIYPWIISIPLLALLVVNKKSGWVWGVISYIAMVWFGILAYQGVELPIEYNPEMKTLWFISVVPGLLLIILFIAFVFEYTQSAALKRLEESNGLLKKQKDTISHQSSELKDLLEEKNYIIRVLAHDLKGPLSNIDSITKLMESDLSNFTKYKDMIMKSNSKAQHLLSRVIEMDVTDQNDIVLQLENLRIEDILGEVINYEQDYALKKGIKMYLDVEDSINLINADKTHIVSVFENLISNAIKFSEKETEVNIVVKYKEGNVQVAIIDQGLGIKANEEDRLFKKFSKLSTRPTAEEPSTGLGLYLVKRHVELIGGRVWYKPNLQKGSSFIVEIPLIS